MSAPDPVAVVIAFNDAINTGDLAALAVLMTAGHRFVDTAGRAVEGRVACTDAWRGFFAAYPDYRNQFESFDVAGGGHVHVVGHSTCPSEPALDGPAEWLALVAGGLVEEWRVSAPSS